MDKRYEDRTPAKKRRAEQEQITGEDSFREVRPMFVVAITPENLKVAETPIPRAFLRKYGKRIANTINLCFRNGDIYQCRMCKGRSAILGMLKIFQRWGMETFSLLVFEQITIADFMVIVIAPTATDIIYHGECIYQPYQKEVSQNLGIGAIKTIESAEGIKNNQNRAMVFWNAKEHPERTIEFLFTGDDVEIPDNKVVIPRMFWNISDNFLKPMLDIVISGGRRFQCQHQIEAHKLVELHHFLNITGVEEGNLLLFRYASNSVLAVTLLNRGAVKFKGRLFMRST